MAKNGQKKGQNGPKMSENGRKWTQNGPKISQKMGPKWTKLAENTQTAFVHLQEVKKGSKKGQNWGKLVKMTKNNHIWPKITKK